MYLITSLFIFFALEGLDTFQKNTIGPFKDELTFKMAKSLEQEKGTNLCGFYVCDYIWWFTTERRARAVNLEVRKQYSQFYFITINCVELYSTYIYPY
jgi:hypothetical protein